MAELHEPVGGAGGGGRREIPAGALRAQQVAEQALQRGRVRGLRQDGLREDAEGAVGGAQVRLAVPGPGLRRRENAGYGLLQRGDDEAV